MSESTKSTEISEEKLDQQVIVNKSKNIHPPDYDGPRVKPKKTIGAYNWHFKINLTLLAK